MKILLFFLFQTFDWVAVFKSVHVSLWLLFVASQLRKLLLHRPEKCFIHYSISSTCQKSVKLLGLCGVVADKNTNHTGGQC